MGYRIQGTQSEGANIWKTSLKIGITTTSKVDDIHMSWSKQNYFVIVGVNSSWKCDNFTLLQRHILNRLYQLIGIHIGTNPYQIELVETLVWTLCTEIHIIENYMVKLFLVCIPHPVPTILQWLLGTTTSARWLLMDWFYSVRCHQQTLCSTAVGIVFAQSHTTKCNRIECSWVTINTPGWVLMAWLYLAPRYQRRSW